MRILVACEFSGAVRNAFILAGHEAWSCDLLDAEDGSPWHFKCDVREVLTQSWDMVIAFPPCTRLCASGARWWKTYPEEQKAAKAFFMMFATHPVSKLAIENPIGCMSRVWRKPDQIIQPWQFGHGETKATCLWLRGLPLLRSTNVVACREQRIHRMPQSPTRSKERSRTYQGIAQAMAEQWS